MRVRLHTGPEAFQTAAAEFMAAEPFTASVIAVRMARAIADPDVRDQDDLWMTVEDATGDVVGIAMRTPPHPPFLSRMPDDASAAVATLLADSGRTLPGVNGTHEATSAFAAAWTASTGQPSTVVTRLRMYRLCELQRPGNTPGRGALAVAPDDIELVAKWHARFHDEALAGQPQQDWLAIATGRIAVREIHLWRVDDRPVSFAGVSPPAAGVARVGPVYTPPADRRRGYGAAVTAAASAAALEAGAEHVVLYADLSNPTSNSIYQAIGYRPDHDAAEHVFR